jgi:hypothetical protein
MSVEVAIPSMFPGYAGRGGCPAVVLLEGLDGERLLAPFQDAGGCGSSCGDGSDKGDLVLVGSSTYTCAVGSWAATPGRVHHQLHLAGADQLDSVHHVDGLAERA